MLNLPRVFLALGCAGLLLLIAGCSESDQPPQAVANGASSESAALPDAPLVRDCRWVMGWDPWEPYQYMDVGNQVRGLDVELVGAAAEAVGCDLEFRRDDWLSLLDQMKSGDIDLLAGATQTEDREVYAHFSSAYRQETFQLFVRADDREKHSNKSLDELLDAGFEIGVTAGYFYGDAVAALEADAAHEEQFLSVDSGFMHFPNLFNHDIEGFLEDEFVAASLIRRQGLEEQVAGPVLEIGDTPVKVMFSKATINREQVKAFNAALEELRTTGRYASIVSQYLPPAS